MTICDHSNRKLIHSHIISLPVSHPISPPHTPCGLPCLKHQFFQEVFLSNSRSYAPKETQCLSQFWPVAEHLSHWIIINCWFVHLPHQTMNFYRARTLSWYFFLSPALGKAQTLKKYLLSEWLLLPKCWAVHLLLKTNDSHFHLRWSTSMKWIHKWKKGHWVTVAPPMNHISEQ